MKEEMKNYKIGFAVTDPMKILKNQKMGKVYFTKDFICYETRAEQMEFFDNPTKIFEHLRNTEVIRMITIRNAAKILVSPVVEIFMFLQTEGGRLYFDERREVEVAIDGTHENNVYDGKVIDVTHQKLFIDGNKQGKWDAVLENIPKL
jgi:hypothetical protein